MSGKFAVVDLFAGPGGLGEGFSAFRTPDGRRPFGIALSVEKDEAAWRTLRLRAFLRQFPDGFPAAYYRYLSNRAEEPDWARLYPPEWCAAEREARRLTLGTPQAEAAISPILADLARQSDAETILIGGPPCQAYSLVGRARNRGVRGYDPAKDERHFLYEEYIRILSRLRPAAFVMENVKGMLSASVEGLAIFERVLHDLRNCVGSPGYVLVPFDADQAALDDLSAVCHPRDFVVCAERFGVPQARHRVIVIGIRGDIAVNLSARTTIRHERKRRPRASVEQVLRSLPRLRSGLSRSADTSGAWQSAVESAMRLVRGVRNSSRKVEIERVRRRAAELLDEFRAKGAALERMSRNYPADEGSCPAELHRWLVDPRLDALPNHESRSHMPEDLARYFFAAVFAETCGRSPKAADFPPELAPDHRSWSTGKFADRFRVQMWSTPSSTITSHIAKDGHYFIHPDPLQCRSLTVREAARLQTFPDNYIFAGNRTQQYVQVGNAVPPFLALQIADFVHGLLAEAMAGAKAGELCEEALAAE